MNIHGSKPIRPDPRDHQFTKVAFAGATPQPLPKTMGRLRMKVKDQGYSLACTAHATTTASSYQEKRDLSAAWHWMETCRKLGTYVPDGADPRSAMDISCKLGDYPDELAPFSFPKDEATLGNWMQWPFIPPTATEPFEKATYVRIPRHGDYFDSLRQALIKDPVMAFSKWYQEWSQVLDVPTVFVNMTGYHAFVFVDFDTDEQGDFIWAQNSYGETWGDRGFQKFRRETINAAFADYRSGLFQFVDLTPEQIQLAKRETPLGRIQRAIIDIWYKLSELYGNITRIA